MSESENPQYTKYRLGFYIPVDIFNPSNHENHKFSQNILKLKYDKDKEAIEYFHSLLKNTKLLKKDYVLVPIPSSIAGDNDTGIHRLVTFLTMDSRNLKNGNDVLVRHTSVMPSHKKGERSIEKHLKTISLNNPELIKGKDVLLLDDVSTSGSILNAGCKLLQDGGAGSVAALALGSTWRPPHIGSGALVAYCIGEWVDLEGNVLERKKPLLNDEYKKYQGLYGLIHPLSHLTRVGKGTIRYIVNFIIAENENISNIQDLVDLLRRIHNQNSRVPVLSFDEILELLHKSEALKEELRQQGIQVIDISEPYFPKHLYDVKDVPVLLFVKGDQNVLNQENAIAVVGTRQPTNKSKEEAYKIAKYFAERGYVIVSGLALGCDTAAHEGALAADGKTIAVLAHGLDMIYPPENESLAEKIIENGGCLISEYPIGERPKGYRFVERDRIQSALSSATIVVESPQNGGSIHTAKFCIEQGRELATVHYENADLEKFGGNYSLVRESNAIPLYGERDWEELHNKITQK